MNKKQYEKWYPYGANGFSSKDQDDPFHVKRYANFQLFLDHNPDVVPVKNDPRTQLSILEGGNYSWGSSPTDRRIQFRGGSWDHLHFIRIKGVKKSPIAVTHLYDGGFSNNSESEKSSPKVLLEGLQARSYDNKYDWYVADSCTLQFISTYERLEMLNLEYLGKPLHIVNGTMSLQTY